jgi:hypothetical protein
MTDDLKPNIGDIGYSLIRIGLSLLPYGSTVAELFSAVIMPPIQKRRDKLLIGVAEDLETLKEDFNYEFENLSENPMFITALMQSIQIAIRNHQDEKINALKNAVLNSALKTSPKEDLQLIFLSYIDNFTVLHLKLLEFFNTKLSDDKINEFSTNFTFERFEHENMRHIMFEIGEILEYVFPELEGQKYIYEIVVRDLSTKGLVNLIEDVNLKLDININNNYIADPEIQSVGKMFLSYITPPKLQ